MRQRKEKGSIATRGSASSDALSSGVSPSSTSLQSMAQSRYCLMINRKATNPFRPADLLKEYQFLLKEYDQEFEGLPDLPLPASSPLFFEQGLKHVVALISQRKQEVSRAADQPLGSGPHKFQLSRQLLANPAPMKASERAIRALEGCEFIPNQLQLDKEFLFRKNLVRSKELLSHCLEQSRWGKRKEQVGPENKSWRRVREKEENILLPLPFLSRGTPPPPAFLVLKFAVYSPVTGRKSLQYLTTSDSPISDIRKLPNLCPIQPIYNPPPDLEESPFEELFWSSSGRAYLRQLPPVLSDQRDNGWLGEAWRYIPLEVGGACLYRHMGGCDHMVVLVDAFPPESEAQNDPSCYPVEVFRSRVTIKPCEGCEGVARVGVVGRETSLLCGECAGRVGVGECERVHPYLGS